MLAVSYYNRDLREVLMVKVLNKINSKGENDLLVFMNFETVLLVNLSKIVYNFSSMLHVNLYLVDDVKVLAVRMVCSCIIEDD